MQGIDRRLAFLLILPWLVLIVAGVVWYRAGHRAEHSVNPMSRVTAPVAQVEQVTRVEASPTTPEKTTTKQASTTGAPITLLFGGDLMFDRYIRQVAIRQGNDFVFAPGLRERMQSADAVIANLEGPITDHPSKSIGSIIGSRENYIFSFDSSWAQTLKANNISVVNLGNNHILNFGVEGLAQTEDFLAAAGVDFFGVPRDEVLRGASGVPTGRDLRGEPQDDSHRATILTLKGIKIGLVNENQFVTDGEAKALADAARLRPQVDILIAYTHWGQEYHPATDDEKRRAHALVDAGVDVVIGSHPHVVQETETYRDKKIYYSLGNFVFDQYEQPETTHGLLVELHIDPTTKQLSFDDLPLTLQNTGQTRLSEK